MRIFVLASFLSYYCLSGCSIYSSEGRKLFEQKGFATSDPRELAFSDFHTTDFQDPALHDPNLQDLAVQKTTLQKADNPKSYRKIHNQECWTQPASEPLWRLKANEKYWVRRIRNTSISPGESLTQDRKSSEVLLMDKEKEPEKLDLRIEICIEKN